jgi:flagellar hook-associated protein 2
VDGNESTVTKTITAQAGADGSLQSVIDNMNQQLADSGIDMEVSYNASKGALQFVNNTAQPVKGTNDAGEEVITGYEGGIDYTITASDDDSAKALGLSTKGSKVSQQTNDTGDNIFTMSNAFNVTSVSDTPATITGSTKLTDMGIANGTTYTIKVGSGDDQTEYNFTIDQTTTLSGLASQFSKMGVTASFDAKQGRFFLNSVDSGEANNFELTADNEEGLRALGLDTQNSTKIDAQDAIVEYNGATFQQASNTFSLNGLNFTANDVTTTTDENGNVKDNPIKMTVSTDTDAIYNAVKDFIKEYNSLIDEMNTLYNADSAKDYDMLTDDDKESMSDTEVEEWENKIKASLLRRDDTISSLLSTMRSTLNGRVSYTGTDGVTKSYALSSFGITTGSWSEYGKLHIYGDSDDSEYSSYDDKLRAAIDSNPDALIATLSGLGSNLYKKMQTAMKSSNYSSALTFYNDKQLDSQISDYDDKIDTLTDKMNTVEDRYYTQFANMETALTKLQSTQSSFSSYFGS